MICLRHSCICSSETDEGRDICIDPDICGWICEFCWLALTTGSDTEQATLASVGEYEMDPQAIRQRARERGIVQRSNELDSVFIANQRAREHRRNQREERAVEEEERAVEHDDNQVEVILRQLHLDMQHHNEVIERAVSQPKVKPFVVAFIGIGLMWLIIIFQLFISQHI